MAAERTNQQLVETLTQLRDGISCCVCMDDANKEFVVLPCCHSLCVHCFHTITIQRGLEWCVQCKRAIPPSSKPLPRFRINTDRFKEACAELLEIITPLGRQPAPPQLARDMERHLLQGAAGEVNIAVVGVYGAGKSTLISAITGSPTVGGEAATTKWSAYRTHVQSKVNWWDSKGVSSWSSGKAVGELMTQMDNLERKQRFQFKLVIVVIHAWQKVRMVDLERLLTLQQRKGRQFVLVTSNMASLTQAELKHRRDDLRHLLRPFGGMREHSAYVDTFIATDAPNSFSIFVNSTTHEATSYGPAVRQEGINELVVCALSVLCDRDWMGDEGGALSLLYSIATSNTVVSGGVLLLVFALASRTRCKQLPLEPLAMLAESGVFNNRLRWDD